MDEKNLHEGGLFQYNLVMTKKIIQKNYTNLSSYRQMVLMFDYNSRIPDDSPVRLLNTLLEELDYGELLCCYSSCGRKTKLDPVTIFKIIIYAMAEGIYSTREIADQCRKNMEYIWLMNGMYSPSHMVFERFFQRIPVKVIQRLAAQLVLNIFALEGIAPDELYIDGTKIEANANRYTAVWRKSVLRRLANCPEKLKKLQQSLQDALKIDVSSMKLEEILAKLSEVKHKEDISFVSGPGHHKNPLQRFWEETVRLQEKQQEYEMHLQILGQRNSYSKTDPDATFMRMKDDHLQNGQLKPAYNVQVAVSSEYVIGIGVYPNPNDILTLRPFLQQIETWYPGKFHKIVADAGYEGESNYDFLHTHGYASYIHPKNAEQKKKKSFRTDIGRMENMTYVEEGDYFICAKGRHLTKQYTRDQIRADGYVQTTSVYACQKCSYCGYRKQCQKKGNQSGLKHLYVCWGLQNQRRENEERMNSSEGCRLRMNRGIQVEGWFGILKQDYAYRRILRRGKENVLKELLLIGMGANIRKLHNRIQSGRAGTARFELKKA